ncbi:ejaculatory bulb-specific protein 3-like [Sitophilus oryzae]|uniref:Ejaculatory bulb-specific protein 3-like n=1 Tax=Sitophilus oryzae TaxID=7048 RepID=A0A6J2XF79_SITOR|nr:ejaculatory bulb-specific protein 3-like [Sitophilus oryzae]
MLGFAVLLVSISLYGVNYSVAIETATYTTKYDNVDILEVLNNERLLKNYVNCLLDQGPCTSDGMELKQNMPDAITSGCSKCSEKQKEKSEIMIAYLIDNKPDYWTPLQEKYDPTGDYRKHYLESKNSDTSTNGDNMNNMD